jgi:hypothetical protein
MNGTTACRAESGRTKLYGGLIGRRGVIAATQLIADLEKRLASRVLLTPDSLTEGFMPGEALAGPFKVDSV